MPSIIVVSKLKDLPVKIPGVEIVTSRDYLTTPRFAGDRNLRVYNLCRSYRYQSGGYYVSLLAAARGHRPTPDISALQDMRFSTVSRVLTEDIDDLIESSFRSIKSDEFTLSIYFGRNLAEKHDRLALRLFNMFQAPFLRAQFIKTDQWELRNIAPISASEIPDNHREFAMQQAVRFFTRRTRPHQKKLFHYDLAILYDPAEEDPPSDERALKKFMRAGEKLGFYCELITRDDYARLAEFDALFIRTTTRVNHYTYRFARKAEAEGLVVIDDSESIIRCSNKVFLSEAMKRLHVATPGTWILHRDNLEELKASIEYPCVLKLPDSAFSQGVLRIHNAEEMTTQAELFFKKSDLLIAQAFVTTTFDWRIGILDNKVIFACKYYMARSHWQIIKKDAAGKSMAGKVETLPVQKVPEAIISLALNATSAIGNGLYGVDIKQHEDKVYLIEVNDNPNIDAGYEDLVLKDKLYEIILKSFLRRIEARIKEAKRI